MNKTRNINKIFIIIAFLTVFFTQLIFWGASGIIAEERKNNIVVTPLSLTGTGTYLNPYLVNTDKDLNNLCAYTNSGGNTAGVYFKLTSSDLNADGAFVASLTEPIGTATYPFMGIFDGDNITLTGASFATNANNQAGIFGQVKNATIQNLTVAYNSTNTTATTMGGIVASAYSSNIINCTNKTDIYNTTGDAMIAGIVGYAHNLNIENCTNEATIKCLSTGEGISSAGGIVGFGYNTNISYCKITPNITPEINGGGGGGSSSEISYRGGIAGSLSGGSTKESYNTATISASGTNESYAGGIVGKATNHTITNCFNRGNVSASAKATSATEKITIKYYGVKASNVSKYNDSYYNKTTTTIKAFAGGISGEATTISNCYNTGTVSGGSIKYFYDLNYILLYTKQVSIYGAPIMSSYAEYIKGTITIINKYYYDGIMPSNSSTSIYSTFNNVSSDAIFNLKSEFEAQYYENKWVTEHKDGTFSFCSTNSSYITRNMKGNTNGVVTKKVEGKYVLSAPFKDLKVYITYSSNSLTLKHGYKPLKDSTYSSVYKNEQTDTIINETLSRQDAKTNVISYTNIKSSKIDGSDKTLPSGFSSTVWAYSSLINDGYPHLVKNYWQDSANA